MSVKENRPDVCATFGTANPISRNDTTDTRLGQVPYACSAVVDEYISLDGFADYCREQCITYDDVLRDSTLMYLSEIDRDDPPSQGELKHALLAATNRCIEAYNMGEQNEAAPPSASLKDRFPSQKPAGERYKRLSGLHPLQIALVLRELHGALGIRLDESNSDENFDIGVFQRSGSKKGTYDTCPVSLERLIRSYDSAISVRGVAETEAVLRSICEVRPKTSDPDLGAVNNGVYDYDKKFLYDFDPGFVFTSKSHVNFKENPPNPVIHNDEDGTDWDVETWMSELSDDPSMVNLLWQVLGAALRPNVAWHKTAWFYSDSGNNGKGTLCTLMRNLLGDDAWASLPLKAFSNPFMLEPLSRVSAIITDENDTGTFVDDAAALKSVITHDPFLMDRKFKAPRSVLFNGFMVQCVNELPKLRDKSESLYRRLLVIPFEKRFEGVERKYIKDDYLYRPEVLEYVMHKLLAETDYYELDVPQACVDMLEEFKLENDPVRQFAEEAFAEAAWDLLPYKFMYDFYRHWFQRNMPSGRPVGRNAFLKSLKGLAAEYGWLAQDKVRSDGRMDKPEPLILEYDVREWMNSGYTGSDPGRKCMPDLAESYRGFVRVSTAGSDEGNETDSEDKEE